MCPTPSRGALLLCCILFDDHNADDEPDGGMADWWWVVWVVTVAVQETRMLLYCKPIIQLLVPYNQLCDAATLRIG
jgi:hypothetical protein